MESYEYMSTSLQICLTDDDQEDEDDDDDDGTCLYDAGTDPGSRQTRSGDVARRLPSWELKRHKNL